MKPLWLAVNLKRLRALKQLESRYGEMERGSRDLRGVESSTIGGGDEKDQNVASSHRKNETEDEEFPDSESEETISAPRTSPRGEGGARIVEAIGKRQANTLLT